MKSCAGLKKGRYAQASPQTCPQDLWFRLPERVADPDGALIARRRRRSGRLPACRHRKSGPATNRRAPAQCLPPSAASGAAPNASTREEGRAATSPDACPRPRDAQRSGRDARAESQDASLGHQDASLRYQDASLSRRDPYPHRIRPFDGMAPFTKSPTGIATRP